MEKINNLIVFYLDVGQMTPQKAETYIERIKDNMNKTGIPDRLKEQGVEMIWIPVRQGSQNSVELIPL